MTRSRVIGWPNLSIKGREIHLDANPSGALEIPVSSAVHTGNLPEVLNSLVPARGLPRKLGLLAVRIWNGGPGCSLARTKGC